jgi:hypothetical protein
MDERAEIIHKTAAIIRKKNGIIHKTCGDNA